MKKIFHRILIYCYYNLYVLGSLDLAAVHSVTQEIIKVMDADHERSEQCCGSGFCQIRIQGSVSRTMGEIRILLCKPSFLFSYLVSDVLCKPWIRVGFLDLSYQWNASHKKEDLQII